MKDKEYLEVEEQKFIHVKCQLKKHVDDIKEVLEKDLMQTNEKISAFFENLKSSSVQSERQLKYSTLQNYSKIFGTPFLSQNRPMIKCAKCRTFVHFQKTSDHDCDCVFEHINNVKCKMVHKPCDLKIHKNLQQCNAMQQCTDNLLCYQKVVDMIRDSLSVPIIFVNVNGFHCFNNCVLRICKENFDAQVALMCDCNQSQCQCTSVIYKNFISMYEEHIENSSTNILIQQAKRLICDKKVCSIHIIQNPLPITLLQGNCQQIFILPDKMISLKFVSINKSKLKDGYNLIDI